MPGNVPTVPIPKVHVASPQQLPLLPLLPGHSAPPLQVYQSSTESGQGLKDPESPLKVMTPALRFTEVPLGSMNSWQKFRKPKGIHTLADNEATQTN